MKSAAEAGFDLFTIGFRPIIDAQTKPDASLQFYSTDILVLLLQLSLLGVVIMAFDPQGDRVVNAVIMVALWFPVGIGWFLSLAILSKTDISNPATRGFAFFVIPFSIASSIALAILAFLAVVAVFAGAPSLLPLAVIVGTGCAITLGVCRAISESIVE